MSISAINCTPIKPNVSFGTSDTETQKYNNVLRATDSLNDQLVKSGDVKSPLKVLLSVAVAVGSSFAIARGLSGLCTNLFPSLADKAVNLTRKGANSVKALGLKAVEASKQGGKFAKIEKVAGKGIYKAEELAKTAFKKLSVNGDPKKGLCNVIGIGYAGGNLIGILKKDANKDGVKDIMQKSQNVYTGNKTAYGKAVEAVSTISEIVSSLT